MRFSMREKPLAKTMAPWSIHTYVYKNTKYLAVFYYLYLLFIVKIFQLSIYRYLSLASNEFKGIDNPLTHVGFKCVLFCV